LRFAIELAQRRGSIDGKDVFVKLAADERLDAVLGALIELPPQMVLAIEAGRTGLELGEIDVIAGGLQQIAVKAGRQAVCRSSW